MGKSNSEPHMHFICTPDEARNFIENNKQGFWVSSCGCREKNGNNCSNSKIDVCLTFNPKMTSSKNHINKLNKNEAIELLDYAIEKKLIPRPFRNFNTLKDTAGICFCCHNCCSYFPENVCDKGEKRPSTNKDCIDCGKCSDACHFNARKIEDNKLKEELNYCYGCGLCATVCPTEAISFK